MKKLLLVLLLAGSLVAQTKPKDLTAEQKLSLSQAQHKLDTVHLQLAGLQQQIDQAVKQLQAQQDAAQKAFDAEVEKAYKEAGVKREEFDLNLDTLTFTAKAKVK